MTLLAAWARGRLLEPGEAAVAPDDPAFTVGRGLFETLRVTGGVPIDTDAHLRRLTASARALGFEPVDVAAVQAGITAVLSLAPPDDARLRYTVSPTGAVVVALATTPLPPESISAVTVPWPRNEASPLVAHKTTSYGECAWALEWARRAGAGEALFRNTRGRYCEGATSNLFVVDGDAILTPPVQDGLLPGVVRAKVMAVATAHGLPVREASIECLTNATEVFLTSSLKGVVPVDRIDGRAVATGPVTRTLRHLLREDDASPSAANDA